MNKLFVRYQLRTVKVLLLLCTDPLVKTIRNLKFFLSSLEDLINETAFSNSLFYVIFGDFNARSPTWSTDDKTSVEDAQLDEFIKLFFLSSWTSLAYNITNTFNETINITYRPYSYFVIYSGVHPSLHTNCHQQITYCKLNLSIKFPYEQLVWDYNKGDIDQIKISLEKVNWENMF